MLLGVSAVGRGLLFWLLVTALCGGVGGLARPVLAASWAGLHAGGSPPFVTALTGLAGCAATVAATWLWAVVSLVTVNELRGRRPATLPCCPGALRRLVVAVCGIALTGAVAPGGHAHPTLAEPGHPARERASAPPIAVLEGLPLPDRAESAQPTGGPPGESRAVVVAAGDTLWDLAAATLPADAGAAEVTARWHRIYRANRTVIGPDPDLIFPGTLLTLATPSGITGEDRS